MTSTNQIAAFLSDKIYDDVTVNQTFGLPGQVATRFEVVDVSPPNSSGYYGAVIKDTDTGKISLVSRGVQPTTVQDLTSAIDIAFTGDADDQYQVAEGFLNSYAGAPIDNFIGHSMGGVISQGLGIEYGLEVISIGAPGANGMLDDLYHKGYASEVLSYDRTKITNYVNQSDFVSTFGTQISGVNVVDVNFSDLKPLTEADYLNKFLSFLGSSIGASPETLITTTALFPGGYAVSKQLADVFWQHDIDNFGYALGGAPSEGAGYINFAGTEFSFDDGNGNIETLKVYDFGIGSSLEEMGVALNEGDVHEYVREDGLIIGSANIELDVIIDSQTYAVTEIADSIEAGAEALGTFVSSQGDSHDGFHKAQWAGEVVMREGENGAP